jgi:hypothetical protein
MTDLELIGVREWIKDKRKEISRADPKPSQIVVSEEMHALLCEHATLVSVKFDPDNSLKPSEITFRGIPVVVHDEVAF